ncbi:MAG: hypothetical protein ACJ8LM_12755 [Candidatus Udaeobacter sp.]
MPDAQGQTLYRNGTALSTVQRGLAEQRFAIEGSTKSDVQANQLQQAKIVQTIKNALLTSSSLNDVIGEL